MEAGKSSIEASIELISVQGLLSTSQKASFHYVLMAEGRVSYWCLFIEGNDPNGEGSVCMI